MSSIAATVEVTLADGSTLSKPFVSGEGLCSDPSHILIFGLGDQRATHIQVTHLNGAQDGIAGNLRNEMVTFDRVGNAEGMDNGT